MLSSIHRPQGRLGAAVLAGAFLCLTFAPQANAGLRDKIATAGCLFAVVGVGTGFYLLAKTASPAMMPNVQLHASVAPEPVRVDESRLERFLQRLHREGIVRTTISKSDGSAAEVTALGTGFMRQVVAALVETELVKRGSMSAQEVNHAPGLQVAVRELWVERAFGGGAGPQVYFELRGDFWDLRAPTPVDAEALFSGEPVNVTFDPLAEKLDEAEGEFRVELAFRVRYDRATDRFVVPEGKIGLRIFKRHQVNETELIEVRGLQTAPLELQ